MLKPLLLLLFLPYPCKPNQIRHSVEDQFGTTAPDQTENLRAEPRGQDLEREEIVASKQDARTRLNEMLSCVARNPVPWSSPGTVCRDRGVTVCTPMKSGLNGLLEDG